MRCVRGAGRGGHPPALAAWHPCAPLILPRHPRAGVGGGVAWAQPQWLNGIVIAEYQSSCNAKHTSVLGHVQLQVEAIQFEMYC